MSELAGKGMSKVDRASKVSSAGRANEWVNERAVRAKERACGPVLASRFNLHISPRVLLVGKLLSVPSFVRIFVYS